MDPLPPIPTPSAQRWREFRIRILPMFIFGIAILGVVVLWQHHTPPSSVVGTVEAESANIISTVPCTLQSLQVERFQMVTKGQPVAQIFTTTVEILRAPMDGMVTAIHGQPGERIMPDKPILVITAVKPQRIVAYVRQPVNILPQIGDTVQIRRLSAPHETAVAAISAVGIRMETISHSLLPSSDSKTHETGLPFSIKIPAKLNLLPGETVDIVLQTRAGK